MNKTALLLTASMLAITASTFASSADAGPLFSVDPRLQKPQIRSFSNFAAIGRTSALRRAKSI